ncbi:hypothetical protein GCM10022206_80190 [Streptomyces chiangmaiensis]
MVAPLTVDEEGHHAICALLRRQARTSNSPDWTPATITYVGGFAGNGSGFASPVMNHQDR